jgi:hypothetical protein
MPVHFINEDVKGSVVNTIDALIGESDTSNPPDMISILSNVYGVEDTSNLEEFIDNVAEIESSGGRDTVSKLSSAKGIFQFLTKGKGNAFATGLNRTKATYKAKGLEVPSWVEEAKDHGDPNLLSTAQQVDLFLANLYQQKGTDKLFQRILSGDRVAQAEMYGTYHHTIPDITKNKRINEIFSQ